MQGEEGYNVLKALEFIIKADLKNDPIMSIKFTEQD